MTHIKKIVSFYDAENRVYSQKHNESKLRLPETPGTISRPGHYAENDFL